MTIKGSVMIGGKGRGGYNGMESWRIFENHQQKMNALSNTDFV